MTLTEFMKDKSFPVTINFPNPQCELKAVLWQQGPDGAFWASVICEDGTERAGVLSGDYDMEWQTLPSELSLWETTKAKLANWLG